MPHFNFRNAVVNYERVVEEQNQTTGRGWIRIVPENTFFFLNLCRSKGIFLGAMVYSLFTIIILSPFIMWVSNGRKE